MLSDCSLSKSRKEWCNMCNGNCVSFPSPLPLILESAWLNNICYELGCSLIDLNSLFHVLIFFASYQKLVVWPLLSGF